MDYNEVINNYDYYYTISLCRCISLWQWYNNYSINCYVYRDLTTSSCDHQRNSFNSERCSRKSLDDLRKTIYFKYEENQIHGLNASYLDADLMAARRECWLASSTCQVRIKVLAVGADRDLRTRCVNARACERRANVQPRTVIARGCHSTFFDAIFLVALHRESTQPRVFLSYRTTRMHVCAVYVQASWRRYLAGSW